jgi:hypothetical protein
MINKIVEALDRVSCLEGVKPVHSDDDIAIAGGHFDDYLLVYLISSALKRGEMKLEFLNERDVQYAKKLLKMEE